VELVDVHAHLCAPEFAEDLPAVLDAAAATGVTRILAVGENLEDARHNLELADRFPMVRPCAGLYPTVLDEEGAEAMVDFIRKHRHRLAAIGEVGLDHWIVKAESDREVQRKILARFVALAGELDLPLNVHSRYYFSIPPSVVRSPQKQKLVRALPLDRLLLETDSPVLGPDPTQRNEPRNILEACRAIAGLKGVSMEEVARATTANARALFPKAFE
jgi:TatD DNase family protein